MDKIKFSQFEFEEVSNKGKYKSAVESLLFVCGEPISLKEVARILDIAEDQGITYESAQQKIHRIRRKVKKQVVGFKDGVMGGIA